MAQPEVFFCYKKRRKADKRFFKMLKKPGLWYATYSLSRLGFLFFRSPLEMKSKFNEIKLTLQVDDDPATEAYNREAITLLRLFRRP